jgi:hypothetical protein
MSTSPFVLPRALRAHPQLDDYVHALKFSGDGLVEMAAAAGQFVIYQNNAFYHLIMTRALIESERYYYNRDGGKAASDDQLVALGIKPET